MLNTTTTETMSDRGNNCSQSNNDEALFEELYKFCGSESLSEDGLRAIIELHECTPNNDPNINNYGFFHAACDNERITEGILRYLLEYFPNAVRDADGYVSSGEERVGGCTPLHNICLNKNVTLSMVQLLLDAFPDSVSHENNDGYMPIHVLCANKNRLDEEVGLKTLKLLLEKFPESVKHASGKGLPIHIAAARQSPDFCRTLIETYPRSERITYGSGILPFHVACTFNTVAAAKFLYELYPESIDMAGNDGIWYPIHLAIAGIKFRDYSPDAAVEMTQFLLECDSNVALHQYDDELGSNTQRGQP